MTRLGNIEMLCVATLACLISVSSVLLAQPPGTSGRAASVPARPRQPGGLLKDSLGLFTTIEGTMYDGGGKVESNTLVVDTVDGNKLGRAVMVLVTNVQLPARTRCILKGYELGEMIGSPPALRLAAKEQGEPYVERSATVWRWRPYFVVLIAAEPKNLRISKPGKS